MPAGDVDVEVRKGTYADAVAEVPIDIEHAELVEHGIARPVSPDRPFVTEEEAELYVIQPMSEDFRRERGEAKNKRSGGLRKNRTKKGGKKGKNKKTKRKSRKSRKSRN